MKTNPWWYTIHILASIEAGEAADDTEAAVNVIIRAVFGEAPSGEESK